MKKQGRTVDPSIKLEVVRLIKEQGQSRSKGSVHLKAAFAASHPRYGSRRLVTAQALKIFSAPDESHKMCATTIPASGSRP